MTFTVNTRLLSHANAENAYPRSWHSLGETGANRLLDIQDTGKIRPAPLILDRPNRAVWQEKGLNTSVSPSTKVSVGESLPHFLVKSLPTTSIPDLRSSWMRPVNWT
jgi:hypothetical protein